MKKTQPLRPNLIFNSKLIREFMGASLPCCTVGLLEEHGAACAFFAIRPNQSIRSRNVSRALSHGHALLGRNECEVLQFGFTFFEFSTYHVLVNPINPVMQAVLDSITATNHYFVFAINPDNRITAFRADLTLDNMTRLIEYRRRTRTSRTTDAEYQGTLRQFRLRPNPPGHVLDCVCCDNVDYLDLSHNRLELFPAT